MKCGGAKMKSGGATIGGSNASMGIFGVPNAGPTGPNKQGIDTMKKGGSTSRAVQTSCKNGLVRMPDGRCGTRETPSFKKGGSTFGMLSVKAGVDKNPRPTAADRIAGAKMSKKKMGGATKKKC
jgi:hypothetical protein